MRHLLTTAALAVTAGLGLFNGIPSARAQWQPMLIEQPRFQPNFGSGYNESRYSSVHQRSNERRTLIEQPRFQPNFGSGSYGNTYRTNSW